MYDKENTGGDITRRSDISSEDQEIMQGLYNNDKKLTYGGIAELYRSKYPEITESIVGKTIRDRNKRGEQYAGMQNKVKNPLEFADMRINTQRQRRG